MSKQDCVFWHIVSFFAGLIFACFVIFPMILLIHFMITDMDHKLIPSGKPAAISYTNNRILTFTNTVPSLTLGTNRELRLEIFYNDGSREAYILTPISLRPTPVTNVSTYEGEFAGYKPEYSIPTLTTNSELLYYSGVQGAHMTDSQWTKFEGIPPGFSDEEIFRAMNEAVDEIRSQDTNDVYRQRFLRIDHIKE